VPQPNKLHEAYQLIWEEPDGPEVAEFMVAEVEKVLEKGP